MPLHVARVENIQRQNSKMRSKRQINEIAPATNHHHSITRHTEVIIPAITAVTRWKTRRCCPQIADLLDISRNDRTTEVNQCSNLVASSQNQCHHHHHHHHQHQVGREGQQLVSHYHLLDIKCKHYCKRNASTNKYVTKV